MSSVFFDYFSYGVIFLIFSYQLNFGIKGLTKQEFHLHGFQFFLFLYFLSSEISRSFFPIFVSNFDIEIENNLKMSIPQFAWALGVFLATPYAWKISKKVDIYHILQYCCFITFFTLVGIGLTHDYFLMLFLRIIHSICFGIVSLLAVVYLVNIDTKAGIMKFFLYALSFSSIAGNPIGGFLSTHYSYSNIIFFSSFLSLIAFIILPHCFQEQYANMKEQNVSINYKSLLTNLNIQSFSLLTTLPSRFILAGCVLFFIPIYMHHLDYSMDKIGQTIMLFFLINAFLLDPISHIIDKYKISHYLLLLSLFLIASSIIGFFYFSYDYIHLLICVGFLSIGMSISNCLQIPIIPILLAKECMEFGRNNVIAYIRTIERIGSTIAALVIAFLYKIFHNSMILILGYSTFLVFTFTILFLIKLRLDTNSSKLVST